MQILDSDCLLIIDVQNDFCPNGLLAVPQGDQVVPVINSFSHAFRHIVATQDWHPAEHSSFASNHVGHKPFDTLTMPYGNQTLWPAHCVQGTIGADFHPDLNLQNARCIIRKGMTVEMDSYSAFFENDQKTTTGLDYFLQAHGVRRVFLSGLATDFCVAWTAIDAIKKGFTTILIEDACRAIDLAGSLAQAKSELSNKGVQFIQSDDIKHAKVIQ